MFETMRRTLPAIGTICSAVLLSGCAAQPYYASPATKMMLPAAGKQQPLGETSILPDQPLLETPVGFREAARLAAPAKGSVVGKAFAFVPGDILGATRLSGQSAGLLAPRAATFCGQSNVDAAKTLLSASTLGLTSLLNKTGNSAQVCLVDSEGDNQFDQALLVGIKSVKDAAPVAITPTAYERLENSPMAGESYARIVYRGKTGLIGGHISFDLAVVENGTRLYFDNVRTTVDLKELPKTVTLMGATFTVQSYDPADGRIRVNILRGFQQGSYGISTTTRTQYIPIYVPR